jgi:hypothetical protein
MRSEGLETIRIVLFATLAAIVYGVIHDLITAHLCVEYFTIAHPPVFATDSPVLLALGWGILATWWVGLILGLALAAAARLGPPPRLGLGTLRRPIVLVMAFSALAALGAGILGALFAANTTAPTPDAWAPSIPPGRYVAFTAVAWAHGASYAAGGLGGLVVILHTLRRRRSARRYKPAD